MMKIITRTFLENKKLNSLDIYINKECVYCGRKYPETVLNIEGHIHHKEPYRCLNLKECNKIIRKTKWVSNH